MNTFFSRSSYGLFFHLFIFLLFFYLPDGITSGELRFAKIIAALGMQDSYGSFHINKKRKEKFLCVLKINYPVIIFLHSSGCLRTAD